MTCRTWEDLPPTYQRRQIMWDAGQPVGPGYFRGTFLGSVVEVWIDVDQEACTWAVKVRVEEPWLVELSTFGRGGGKELAHRRASFLARVAVWRARKFSSRPAVPPGYRLSRSYLKHHAPDPPVSRP